MALAFVLAAVVPLTTPRGSFTSDEGAYALQVRSLQAGSWQYPYRAAELDPGGRHFPLVLADRQGNRFFPYVKHPAYPVILRAAVAAARWAGLSSDRAETVGLRAVPLLGAVLAAVSAWLLAAELAPGVAPGVERAAFWMGALSPVAVNGLVVWAHALSAALAGLALVGSVRLVRRGVTPARVAATGGALAAGALLRSEGLLLAAALVASVSIVMARQPAGAWRDRVVRGGAVGLALAAPVVTAAVVERLWLRSITGAGRQTVQYRGGGSSFVWGRLTGAWHELVGAHFLHPEAAVPALLALGLVAGLGWSALRRWGPGSGRDLALALCGGVVLYALRFVWFPRDALTGLFPAWPLALLGLALFPWRGMRTPTALVVGTTGLFAAAILATQYAEGGGLEWGGRFLSPVAVPVAVLACTGLASRLAAVPVPSRRRAVAGLAAVAVVATGVGVGCIASLRASEDRLVAAVARHPAPVTVTTVLALPRLAWRTDDRLSWMLARNRADLQSLLESLHARGVPTLAVLVGTDLRIEPLGGYRVVREPPERALRAGGMRLLILGE